MTKKKTVFDVSIDFNEVNAVENIISKILDEDNFNKLNNLQNNQNSSYFNINSGLKIVENNENIEFIAVDKDNIAPYSQIISEKEFFKIVGRTKKGLSKRSGKYQESLYEFYIKAVQEADNGFISDVLNKAVIFNNNLNYVKSLTKNKKFMSEWRKNFGKETPVNIFKNSGNLRKINIINERIR